MARSVPIDPLRDPRCLVTTDAIVIDGANGVCHDARIAGGRGRFDSLAVHTALSLAVLAASLIALSLVRRGPARPVRALRGLAPIAPALVLALVAALPGVWALTYVRADAPHRWPARAARLAQRLDTVVRFAAQHQGCVIAELSACPACDPLVRYAVPVHRARCPRIARITFGRDGLAGACIARGPDALWCGADETTPHAPDARRVALAPAASPPRPRTRTP